MNYNHKYCSEFEIFYLSFIKLVVTIRHCSISLSSSLIFIPPPPIFKIKLTNNFPYHSLVFWFDLFHILIHLLDVIKKNKIYNIEKK